jgi:hypothetical protein
MGCPPGICPPGICGIIQGVEKVHAQRAKKKQRVTVLATESVAMVTSFFVEGFYYVTPLL